MGTGLAAAHHGVLGRGSRGLPLEAEHVGEVFSELPCASPILNRDLPLAGAGRLRGRNYSRCFAFRVAVLLLIQVGRRQGSWCSRGN